MTGDSATFRKFITRAPGPTRSVRMVRTFALRAEHEVALRGGTRGLLSRPAGCRRADWDGGDPAGTGALWTGDQPLAVRELPALLHEELVADLGGGDQGGGGVVPVPLGSAGGGPVDDVGHGSPGGNSAAQEVLFAEVFPLSLHIGYEGQSPVVLAFAALQGQRPAGGNLARRNVTMREKREERGDLT